MRRRTYTAAWLITTLGVGGYLALAFIGQDRRAFMPGAMTGGHHQIELACESCHSSFAGIRQGACMDCHAAEFEAVEDSHSASKFSDPRNAGDLAKLDVRQCTTCHTEHRPEITGAAGVTLPVDFCQVCHEDVGEERATHEDIAFDTCASAGCHNYHDNRALYEDFLVQHGDAEADTLSAELPLRDAWIAWEAVARFPLAAADADGTGRSGSRLVEAWADSGHASSGVNCTDCHQGSGSIWTDSPSRDVCDSCHALEPRDFVAGKHGMRLSVGLGPMSPSMARLPMRPEASGKVLDCGTCHDAHRVDVNHAAVDACLACHADKHSKSYADSPHFRLWQLEVSGRSKPGTGVSCASCHMPREPRRIMGSDRIVVQHNQNANLRPNEKMIREVCLTCHTLALTIDALADPAQIRSNFSGLPSRHVRSIDMALSRAE